MTPHLTMRCSIVGALLLQACAAPGPMPLAVKPALQVRHSSSDTAEAYYQLGRQHLVRGDLALALTGFNYAIARDPGHAEARTAAAAIHAQQGRLPQARAMLLAVATEFPSTALGLNNLGYVDYLRGEYGAAVQALRRALELDPANTRARNNLQLAETALKGATPAASGASRLATSGSVSHLSEPLLAAQPPLATILAGSAPSPQLELMQVVPNIFQLQVAHKPVIPAPALGAVPARLEVANGVGATGLARRVGALLGRQGMPVTRLSNARPFGQPITRIEYRAGHASQAEAVRKVLGGFAMLSKLTHAGSRTDIRVVLGEDLRQATALHQENPAASVRLARR